MSEKTLQIRKGTRYFAVVMVIVCMVVLAGAGLAVMGDEAEGTQRETFVSGDYAYVLLDDGTAEIVEYFGIDEMLTIPDNLDGIRVTSIGNEAFSLCYRQTEITIPDSVTSIGDRAFENCDKLTEFTIPDSITEIGINPFNFCDNLSTVSVSLDHPTLEVIDGVLFSKPDKRLVYCPMTKEGAYTIPQGILEIGDRAFNGCSSLTAITIPDSVTEMGANPFSNCSNLSTVSISIDHPTLEVIDGVLFSKPDKRLVYCPMTKEGAYTIPQGILEIGDGAFACCSGLTEITIPDSVTSIGDAAFVFCDSLTEITIPDSVTSIGDEAFAGCDNLTLKVGRDSYAEQYCEDNYVAYEYSDSLD